jgi:hypothetical protein
LPKKRDGTKTSAWYRDRAELAPPAPYAGKIEAQLFRLLKCGDTPSPDRIERILAACEKLPPFGDTPGERSATPEEVIADAFDEETKFNPVA